MTRHAELTKLIRTEIQSLDVGGTGVVPSVIENLKAGGVVRNIHLGNTNLDALGALEWYGGQILDILEDQSWFAVNSLINCVDKFAPELPE